MTLLRPDGEAWAKSWEDLVVKSHSVLHIDRKGDAQRHGSVID